MKTLKTPTLTLALALSIAAVISGCSSQNRTQRVHSTAAIGAVGGYPIGAYEGRLGSGATGGYLYEQHAR